MIIKVFNNDGIPTIYTKWKIISLHDELKRLSGRYRRKDMSINWQVIKNCNLKLIFVNKDHVIECIISYAVLFCLGILFIEEPQCNINLSQEIISNLESHSIFNLLGISIL